MKWTLYSKDNWPVRLNLPKINKQWFECLTFQKQLFNFPVTTSCVLSVSKMNLTFYHSWQLKDKFLSRAFLAFAFQKMKMRRKEVMIIIDNEKWKEMKMKEEQMNSKRAFQLTTVLRYQRKLSALKLFHNFCGMTWLHCDSNLLPFSDTVTDCDSNFRCQAMKVSCGDSRLQIASHELSYLMERLKIRLKN